MTPPRTEVDPIDRTALLAALDWKEPTFALGACAGFWRAAKRTALQQVRAAPALLADDLPLNESLLAEALCREEEPDATEADYIDVCDQHRMHASRVAAIYRRLGEAGKVQP